MLPVSVIEEAAAGKSEAVSSVLQYYSHYINYLASRYGYLDVEAVCCMEAQLTQALLKFDTNR